MPFTPFHMGPGLAIKGVAGAHFSLLMFGITQVAMDIEPGIGLIRGWDVLHGWTHTYVGATIIALVVLALGRPLCVAILKAWNRELVRHDQSWLASSNEVTWAAAAAGAFVGAYSHVALDSIMHFDMHPFSPWASANPSLELLSYRALHVACVAAGVAGTVLWFAAKVRARRRQRD